MAARATTLFGLICDISMAALHQITRQCLQIAHMKKLVLKPSNSAVNHVHYPSSHQRNSERPNTANYCSCWQIQPQNHATSCQLHALTTVTTGAAIMTGSTGDSKVYLCFIFPVVPAAVSSSCNRPEKHRREIHPNIQFLLVF